MVLLKFGEVLQFSKSDIKPPELIESDPYIMERFKMVVAETKAKAKQIAPKANDFLYFSAIMMHAAERALYNDDGTPKLDKHGNVITANWDIDEKTGVWKWNCSDPTIRPVKNNNNDIFPEKELKIAYKKWVGKPLCKDHQSNTVDGVRGIILDTYYDDRNKCIIALCALDKVNYPDLARKIEAGYMNSVSMGTAVGKSICFDCGNVAKTESEYCVHVKTKNSYGEINTDLNPIELSIVVNGADPYARVRNIIAATTEIEDALKKHGEQTSVNQLLKIKQALSDLTTTVAELESEILNKANNNLTLTAVATNNEQAIQYQDSLNFIKNKIANVEGMVEKIAERSNTEALMSQDSMKKQSYFQGTVEPKPAPQYPPDKDPGLGVRDQDKHMLQDGNLGPTDGLFPGDLEKKRLIARASIEERRAIRANAVAKAKENMKTAYMQGTTQPTPPQTYKPDTNPGLKVREDDKHMKVDNGLTSGPLAYDDKKVKEMLHRAKLKARFVKVANPEGKEDVANSRWDVLNGDKVIFSATVNELTGGKRALYASVMNKEFAKDMMKTIRASGVKNAHVIYKSAQMPPAPGGDMGGMGGMGGAPDLGGLGGMGAPPPAAPPAGPAGDLGLGGPEEEKEEGDVLKTVPDTVGDPVEKGSEALDALTGNLGVFQKNIDGLVEDLKAGYQTLKETGGAAGVGGGEAAGVGGGEAAGAGEMPAALEQPEAAVASALQTLKKGAKGPESTKALRNIQVVLNAALQDAFKETIMKLNEADNELKMIAETLKMPGIDKVNVEFVKTLAKDAMKEADENIKKAKALQIAFIKYARGTYGLEKKAAIENRMMKIAKAKKEEKKVCKTSKCGKECAEGEGFCKGYLKEKAKAEKAKAEKGKAKKAEDMSEQMTKEATGFDLTTAEGRKMYRHKIASKMLSMSDLLNKAHPKEHKMENLSSKTDEAKVEGLEAVHDDMMAVVQKDPKGEKVKKAAEKLDGLIKAGKVNAGELDELVKNGLDKDAVAYWKKYFGEVEGGKEFATALVQNYETEKKAAVDVEAVKAKIARAYDLAYEMADAGLIPNNKQAIKNEVENVVKWNDTAFESMKRVIAHHKPKIKKQASMPQIGMALDANIATGEGDKDLYQELSEAFAGKKF